MAHTTTFISMGLIWSEVSLQQSFLHKMSKCFSFCLDVIVHVVALMVTGDDHWDWWSSVTGDDHHDWHSLMTVWWPLQNEQVFVLFFTLMSLFRWSPWWWPVITIETGDHQWPVITMWLVLLMMITSYQWRQLWLVLWLVLASDLWSPSWLVIIINQWWQL